jgi:hypothetical protein
MNGSCQFTRNCDLLDTDENRQVLIDRAKQSFRDAQRTRTWEERVAAIERMNAANKFAKQSRIASRNS